MTYPLTRVQTNRDRETDDKHANRSIVTKVWLAKKI